MKVAVKRHGNGYTLFARTQYPYAGSAGDDYMHNRVTRSRPLERVSRGSTRLMAGHVALA
jgi:hypothetical protein